VGAKTDFKEQEALVPLLYTAVLRDTCNNVAPGNAMPDVISHITVYKTAFREKYVETGSVLSPASLNDASRRDTVAYKGLMGYRQDLYLIRVEGRCHPDAWFYFSVWYRARTDMPEQEQFGFGKAYLGVQNESDNTIHFTHSLLMKRCDEGHYLAYKDTAQFFFVTEGLERTDRPIMVNRIVVEEHNKFGGPDAFVFKVADHFPGEMRALVFRKTNSFSSPL
jgi:hypothetical protein